MAASPVSLGSPGRSEDPAVSGEAAGHAPAPPPVPCWRAPRRCHPPPPAALRGGDLEGPAVGLQGGGGSRLAGSPRRGRLEVLCGALGPQALAEDARVGLGHAWPRPFTLLQSVPPLASLVIPGGLLPCLSLGFHAAKTVEPHGIDGEKGSASQRLVR